MRSYLKGKVRKGFTTAGEARQSTSNSIAKVFSFDDDDEEEKEEAEVGPTPWCPLLLPLLLLLLLPLLLLDVSITAPLAASVGIFCMTA